MIPLSKINLHVQPVGEWVAHPQTKGEKEEPYNRCMTDNVVFPNIASELLPIFEELCCREPIFHTAAFGTTLVDFERVMAPDYWEVGASGRRYSRDFILRTLKQKPPIDAASAGWQSSDYGLRRLGPDTYLFTYTLHQAERVTRRATIWLTTGEGWRILYHQGTIAYAGEQAKVVKEISAIQP
jgi:hypothetical protein